MRQSKKDISFLISKYGKTINTNEQNATVQTNKPYYTPAIGSLVRARDLYFKEGKIQDKLILTNVVLSGVKIGKEEYLLFEDDNINKNYEDLLDNLCPVNDAQILIQKERMVNSDFGVVLVDSNYRILDSEYIQQKSFSRNLDQDFLKMVFREGSHPLWLPENFSVPKEEIISEKLIYPYNLCAPFAVLKSKV